MMLHLVVAITATGLFMLLGYVWSDRRDMKRLLRHQQDELRQLQMQLGDVIAQDQHRRHAMKQKLGQMKSRGGMSVDELKKAASHQTRPGETDQELLLR